MRKAAILLAVLVFSVACSASEQGLPTPGGSGGTDTETTGPVDPTTTSAEPEGELPPRPQDLPIDGIKPCDLLTEPQRASLKVERARPTTSRSDAYEGAPECVFTIQEGEPNIDVRLLMATNEGAEEWLTGKRNVDAESTTVNGFGAAHFWFAGGTGAECNTAVDVADGQHFQVGLMLVGQDWTQEKLCETTDRVAEAALTTLRAR